MLGILLILLFTQQKCPPDKIRVVIFEFDALSRNKKLATTVSDLFREELANCKKYCVTDKKTMIDSLGKDLSVKSDKVAMKRGKKLGVSYAIIGKLTKLRDKINIFVSMLDIRDGKIIFEDEERAVNIKEVDVATKKLTNEICELKTKPAEPTRRKKRKTLGSREIIYMGHTFGCILPIGDSYGKDIARKDNRVELKGNLKYMFGRGAVSMFFFTFKDTYFAHELYVSRYTKGEDRMTWHLGLGYSICVVPLWIGEFCPGIIGGGIGLGGGHVEVGVTPDSVVDYTGYFGPMFTFNIGLIAYYFISLNLKYHVVVDVKNRGSPHGFILSLGITLPDVDKKWKNSLK